MYDTMCMTQNMGVIFFENGGVWQKMYDTKIATKMEESISTLSEMKMVSSGLWKL